MKTDLINEMISDSIKLFNETYYRNRIEQLETELIEANNKLKLFGVSRSIGKNTHGVIKTVSEEEKEKFDICQVCKYKGHCGDEIYTVCRDELEIDQCYC